MWGTIQRLSKDRMSEDNLLSPSLSFVKKVDPYLIYLIFIKKCWVVKKPCFSCYYCFSGRINNKKSSSTTRTPVRVKH